MNVATRKQGTDEALTAQEVVDRTGVTLRQLQWWDEKGHLHPAYGIRKHSRLYSADQVSFIAKLVALRKARVSLRQALKCIALGGWERIQVVDRPVAVGAVLLVPPSRKQVECAVVPPRRPQRMKFSSAELDAIALRDPTVARGRSANHI